MDKRSVKALWQAALLMLAVAAMIVVVNNRVSAAREARALRREAAAAAARERQQIADRKIDEEVARMRRFRVIAQSLTGGQFPAIRRAEINPPELRLVFDPWPARGQEALNAIALSLYTASGYDAVSVVASSPDDAYCYGWASYDGIRLRGPDDEEGRVTVVPRLRHR